MQIAPIQFDFIRFNYYNNHHRIDTRHDCCFEKKKKCVLVLRVMRSSRQSIHSVSAFVVFDSISIIFSVRDSLFFFLYFVQRAFTSNAIDSEFNPIHVVLQQPLVCTHIMMCHAISTVHTLIRLFYLILPNRFNHFNAPFFVYEKCNNKFNEARGD